MLPSLRWRIPRRVVGSLLAILTSLCLLELVLQAGGLAIWAVHAMAPGRSGSSDTTILCVGDSFTWGVGTSARDRAYPQRLEDRLRTKTGRDWNVVNAGWPGRNSRDVLTRLPDQIREHRPRYACVLVGVNDLWSLPTQVTVAEDNKSEGDGFRFELRTLRLWKLLAGAGRTRAVSAATTATTPGTAGSAGTDAIATAAAAPAALPQELSGWWMLADLPVHLAPSGALEIGGASVPMAVTGDALRLDLPDGPLAGRWRRTGDVLVLSLANADISLQRVVPPAPPPQVRPDPAAADTLRTAALDALANGRPAEAETLFVRLIALAGHPRDRVGLVRSFVAQGREDAARAAGDALVDDWTRTRGLEAGEVCLEALEWSCRIPDAVRVADDVLRDHPRCGKAWHIKAEWHAREQEHPAAAACYEHAIEFLAEKTGVWRGVLLRKLAVAAAPQDPRRALTAIAEGYTSDHDRPRAAQVCRQVADAIRDVPIDPIVTQVADATDREVLRKMFAERGGSNSECMDILTDHIRQFVMLCRRHAVEPIVVCYPFPVSEIEEAQHRGAEAGQAICVSVWARFAKEFETRKREELLIADGHCNDQGYDIMAEIVVEALLPRLRP